jgi:hypothetical protein
MARRAPWAGILLTLVASCSSGESSGDETTTSVIVAVEVTTTTGAPSTTAAASQHWSGTAHVDGETEPGTNRACAGTEDFTFELDVGPDGTITGTGTGEFSEYVCQTDIGPVTAPGGSGTLTLGGQVADGELVFFPSDFTGSPLGPFQIPPGGVGFEFHAPIDGDTAGGTFHADVTGSLPVDTTLTISLTCGNC